MFTAFFKYFIIKFQSFFIRLCLFSCRINSGPGYARPIYLKSHFSKFSNIFFIMVIEIDTFMGWIKFCISIWVAKHTMGLNICYRRQLSICHICTFILIGSCCSTPQKSFRKAIRNFHITTTFHNWSPLFFKFDRVQSDLFLASHIRFAKYLFFSQFLGTRP